MLYRTIPIVRQFKLTATYEIKAIRRESGTLDDEDDVGDESYSRHDWTAPNRENSSAIAAIYNTT